MASELSLSKILMSVFKKPEDGAVRKKGKPILTVFGKSLSI
jgi:hypothetical protein